MSSAAIAWTNNTNLYFSVSIKYLAKIICYSDGTFRRVVSPM